MYVLYVFYVPRLVPQEVSVILYAEIRGGYSGHYLYTNCNLVCVCVRACVRACVLDCLFACVRAYVHACVRKLCIHTKNYIETFHTSIHTHTHIYIQTHSRGHACTHTRAHTHTHARTHTHTHTNIRTYTILTHTRMQLCKQKTSGHKIAFKYTLYY